MPTISRILRLQHGDRIVHKCPKCMGNAMILNTTSRRLNSNLVDYKFFIECCDPRCKFRSIEISSKDYYDIYRLINAVIRYWNSLDRNYRVEPIIKKEDGFDLREAIDLCRLGYFVKHELFDDMQSMHMYKNHLYYEDGPDLTANELGFNIYTEEFANRPNSWSIKYSPEEIDYKLLDKLHKKPNKVGINYELCIIPTEIS